MSQRRLMRPLSRSERVQLAVVGVAALLLIAYFGYQWRRIHEPVPDLRTRLIQTGHTIKVQVKGSVERPGVYELPPGSSVLDLLRESGAKQVSMVPKRWQEVPLTEGVLVEIWDGADGQPHLSMNRMSSDTLGLLFIRMDLNEATVEDLQSLPGIGAKTAQAIFDYRQTHGPFRTVDELTEVDGVGEKTVETLRYRVAVGRPPTEPAR